MQAKVILIGAARGVGQLTYTIPPALEGRVECGHRVIVPLRSRRLTGIVIEVGEGLEAGAGEVKPILELPESRPLYDRAHLGLIEFMASYYMVPLGDAMQSVVPAAARIESHKVFRLATPPDALRAATMAPMERAIVEALGRRAMTSRELVRLGERREVASALALLAAERIVETAEATRGRHRSASAVRLAPGGLAAVKLRGVKQREIVRLLGEAAPEALALEELEERMPGARVAVRALAERGIVEVESAPRAGIMPYPGIAADRAHMSGSADVADAIGGGDFELMPEQSAAIDTIMPVVTGAREETFLLWGVTASGKTEVYLRLAAAALEAGRQVLLLVPEIALADQIVRSFRARFGPLVGIAHSAQNVAERWASWMAALSGDSRIMIGPRSVVFAPLPDPGLIVVDEEHDSAYKNEEGIRYNARDLAVALGRFANCPVMLGSATPSAESYVNTRRGRYRMLRLARRVGDRALAAVEIIDLREHLRAEQAEQSKDRAREERDGAGTSLRRCAAASQARRGPTRSRRKQARPRRRSGRATLGAAARRAARQPCRGRAERGVSQPPRLSQFPAMPSLRQRDRVPQLQRQHDVSSARPLAAVSLLRRERAGAGQMPRMRRLWSGRAGLRHGAAGADARGTGARRANRADGLRHQRAARGASDDPRKPARAAKSISWSAPR